MHKDNGKIIRVGKVLCCACGTDTALQMIRKEGTAMSYCEDCLSYEYDFEACFSITGENSKDFHEFTLELAALCKKYGYEEEEV